MISRYRDKTGPLVIAAPHMSNWEVGILPLHAINARPAGVYRIVENPYVDRWLRNKRAALYPGGLFATKSDEGLATVMRIAAHLRAGGALGMLADLVDWKGIQVPFFGQMMWATIAPRLARTPRRYASLRWPLRPHRQGIALQNHLQGAESAAHGQAGRGDPRDDSRHTKRIRDLDSGAPGAMDVVQQALAGQRAAGRNARLTDMEHP